jgi:hypothetical protein
MIYKKLELNFLFSIIIINYTTITCLYYLLLLTNIRDISIIMLGL